MQTKLMTIFTRTPLHVGAGSSVGAIDMPVVRERHTRFPVIPGSSIKGVLADFWNEKDDQGKTCRSQEGILLFGEDDNKKEADAGKLLIGEGKLLAFPLRSAKGCFAWVGCPTTLSRIKRDSGRKFDIPKFTADDTNKVYAADDLIVHNHAIFEEYPLEKLGNVPEEVTKALSDLCDDEVWKEQMSKKFAVISDELFAYFAENACEIANHNRINDKTGTVDQGALFSQENVPSETLFYSVINTQEKDKPILELFENKLNGEDRLIQIGANMTTGLGWCSVAMKEVR